MRKFLLAVLMLLLILPSCGYDDGLDVLDVSPSASPAPSIVIPEGPAKSDVFALAYSSTASLNPITGTNRLNRDLAPLMYDGLFEINSDFEAVPVLCDTFAFTEYTWTFTLRSGITFSDGTPLTAADVVYSLTAARKTDSYKTRFDSIGTITAADNETVTITTSRPLGHLELLLDIPIIKDGTADEKTPPGTGRYVFIGAEGDSYLRLADDRRSSATVTRIQLLDLPEPDLLISAFETGTVSAVSGDLTAADPIIFGGDYEEWSYSTTNLYYVGFNTQKVPTELRRIISDAIDRETICGIDLLDRAEAVSFGGGNATLADCLARLEALGYADADSNGVLDFELKLLVCSDNAYKTAAARRIAEDLRLLGIDATLISVGWNAYNSALQSGGYDLYLGETRLTADYALDALVSSGGALNFSGFSSGEVDIKLAEYHAAPFDTLETVRAELYAKLDEQSPITPILFRKRSLLARRGVAGSPSPSQGDVYGNIEFW